MTYEEEEYHARQQDEEAEAAYWAEYRQRTEDIRRQAEELCIQFGRYERAVETAVLERDRIEAEFGVQL